MMINALPDPNFTLKWPENHILIDFGLIFNVEEKIV